jgi:aryl-alcohol dehydrogenase-like predicted oxidoreductase
MAVAKRELGRTGLQVTTMGYGAMELRGAPRARDITEAQAAAAWSGHLPHRAASGGNTSSPATTSWQVSNKVL